MTPWVLGYLAAGFAWALFNSMSHFSQHANQKMGNGPLFIAWCFAVISWPLGLGFTMVGLLFPRNRDGEGK